MNPYPIRQNKAKGTTRGGILNSGKLSHTLSNSQKSPPQR